MTERIAAAPLVEAVKTTEVERQPPAWVIWDLDGVRMRWVKSHLPDPHDQTELLQTIQGFREVGIAHAVLTNRPPGQMAPIAYDMGVDYGIWVTESGGSVYDVGNHMSAVTPAYQDRIPHVQALRRALGGLGIMDVPTSFNGPQFESGMGYVKTVIVLADNRKEALTEYAKEHIEPLLKKEGLVDLFTIEIGKAIDIDPKGLSKSQGMRYLLEVNGIDPGKTPVLWIADAKRDVAAAQVVAQAGGVVAAVGNADPVYREFIESTGGIVAPIDTSYHGSASFILKKFIQRIVG